jgi:RHS repeat-associated protein
MTGICGLIARHLFAIPTAVRSNKVAALWLRRPASNRVHFSAAFAALGAGRICGVRSSAKPSRGACLAQFVPLVIVLSAYAALLCAPGHAVAQTCGSGTLCRGPDTIPFNYYQVCDLGMGCGIGTSEASAIADYEQRAAAPQGYSACSSSYVDQTPGWQPPGIGNGAYGNYSGAPNSTPSFEVAYVYSTETQQTQNPLNFTFTNGPGCSHQFNMYAYVYRTSVVNCPAGFNGWGETPPNAYCWQASASASEPPKNLGAMCPAATKAGGSSQSSSATSRSGAGCLGDPVNPATQNNFQSEADYIGSGPMPLGFIRYYNSLLWNGSTAPSATSIGFWSTLGPNWRSSYDRYIAFDAAAEYATALAYRPDGKALAFVQQSNGKFVPEVDVADRVVQLTNGLGTITGWQFTNAANDEVETYNASGQLMSLTSRSGLTQTVGYNSSGQLTSVTDAFGRALSFAYDSSGRLSTLTDPAGGIYTYAYTSANDVASVTYPDATVRTYIYNEPANTGNENQPYLLTGIIDENVNRFATFQYYQALVTAVNHSGVEQYSFTYLSQNQSTVTDPLGTSRTFLFQTLNGAARTTSVSKTCLTDCAGFAAATTYDTNGNIATRTDFNGNVSSYVYDLTRDLETSRTEAYGTAQARTITTTWDANWRQPDLISEPNRTTGFTYDSLGNVLTKTVTDTTVTPNVARTWTYTYDTYGRMLTAKGPRTDVNSTTTYAYYTCTTGFQCGQVQTITDALGHITTFNTYNAHGQPLTITDPNGVVTTLTYDLRQRLLSRQIGTETTNYSYYSTGLLETVTLPDSSTITYTYDAAHRLTKISDGAGNTISYTLDAMGNRTAESSYDPASTLHRTHSRVFNALNELYQDINSAGTAAVTTTLAYDNDGNVTSSAAPLSRNTADQYDALNRLTQITDPASGITKLGYDANDNLASVIDPRSLTTSYTHNGFGDVTQLVSPDTGTSLSTYDSGGNLKTATDARSALATYSYDAMNRVTQVAYADQTINFTYDAGTNGIGRLTGASDANHTLSWTYDTLGRVTGKGQKVGTITKSVGYAYVNGDLTSLVTPSGQTIVYAYTNHRITSITVNGTTLLSGATYDPFGPATGWAWGNSTASTRSFDKDGNPSQIVAAGVTNGYTVDNASRITGISDSGLSSDSWTFGYDLLDRVTSGSSSAKTRGYTYDANSNQLTTTGTVAFTDTIATTSNRLNSTSGGIARSYGYDNAGNTTSYTGDSFTFNKRGRMSQAIVNGSASNYIYNALGQLIHKSGNGGNTLLMYDEVGHILGEYSSTGVLVQETIWMGDMAVATLRPNGSSITIYYVHADHLGTPRKVTRPSDNGLMWRWDPDTLGSVAPNQNPSGLGTFKYNPRFPGQYALPESGLYYNYFRDYDPQTGRYLESDPIGLKGGINPYAYVGDSPVNLVDPLGLCKIVLQFSRPISRIPAYHISVTTIDSTGTMWFAGGPTNIPIAVSKYGFLRGSSGNDPDIEPLNKVIVDDGKPCSCYNSSFLATIGRTNANDIPYDPLGQNSNSLAGTMLRDAGINVPSASWPYWTPAYSQDLNHFDPFDFLSRSK